MEIQSRNLASEFVVIGPNQAAIPKALTPAMFDELSTAFDGFRRHLLVSCFDFDKDWPVWERHPAGDEIVLLFSGQASLLLQTQQGDVAVRLHEPGSYVIVPKGTWHTARIATPTRLLFITPGEGTENRSA